MLKQPGNSGTDDANAVIGLCGTCDAALLFEKPAVVEAEIRGIRETRCPRLRGQQWVDGQIGRMVVC